MELPQPCALLRPVMRHAPRTGIRPRMLLASFNRARASVEPQASDEHKNPKYPGGKGSPGESHGPVQRPAHGDDASEDDAGHRQRPDYQISHSRSVSTSPRPRGAGTPPGRSCHVRARPSWIPTPPTRPAARRAVGASGLDLDRLARRERRRGEQQLRAAGTESPVWLAGLRSGRAGPGSARGSIWVRPARAARGAHSW